MARRPLRTLELTGARAVIRRVLFAGAAVLAVVGAIGFVLPAHRLDDVAGFHSNYHDGGPESLVVFAAVIAGWWFLRRRGHGAGYLFGVVATAGAVLSVLPVFLVHMFRSVETGPGEGMFAVGVLGLFGTGVVIALAEPILYLGQRRQLERDVDPQFPTARTIRS
jgi:hypothetical protein